MKRIDPIDIKQSIKDGQLEAFAARGKVYIKDVKSGDCVKILEEQPSAEPNLQPTCNQLATDCISRKEAIDAIDGLPNCYNGFSDSYDKAYIIGVLEELPSAEKNGKWIPCSERLPDDDEIMLVTCKPKKGSPNVNRAYYMDGAWHGSGSMSNVTAWMPLPKPYQEDNQ